MCFSSLICLLFIAIFCLFSFSNAIECQISSSKSKIAYDITVDLNGGGNFTKIQDAIDSIPLKNDRWIRILLNPGIYREKVKISEDKSCLVFKGQGQIPGDTKISFDANGKTDVTPTIDIFGENVVFKRIMFENTFIVKVPGKTVEGFTPAVAARVFADKVAFYGCAFKGYQDTLWDDYGRHYFQNCYIEGAVDFIWGKGQSFYETCSINITGGGFVTAQGRNTAEDRSGYVFNNCKVYGEGHGCLGRAYGPYSRVIFVNSMLTNVVDPLGWDIWNQKGHERDIVYGEFNCTGAGVKPTERVPWTKTFGLQEISIQYSLPSFIDQDGWIAKQP